MSLAQRIKEARVLMGMTQKDLADAVAVTRQTIVNIEGGVRGSKKLDEIAKILGVSARWLEHGEGEKGTAVSEIDGLTQGRRVARKRKEKGLTQAQLADSVGVSQPSIAAIENDTTQTTKLIPKIAIALDTSPAWLMYGRGSVDTFHEILQTNDSPITTASSSPAAQDGLGTVAFAPVYRDVIDNEGRRSVQPDYQEQLRVTSRELEGTRVDAKNVGCAKVSDNAFSPWIPRGTCVFFDLTDTAIRTGDIYVLAASGVLYVRHVLRSNDGYVLRSANTEHYPDETWQEPSIKVIGRVFHWSVTV